MLEVPQLNNSSRWRHSVAHNLQEPSYVFRAPKQLSSPLEDILEEGMATQSGVLAERIPTDRAPWWATLHGVTKSLTPLKRLCTHSPLENTGKHQIARHLKRAFQTEESK